MWHSKSVPVRDREGRTVWRGHRSFRSVFRRFWAFRAVFTGGGMPTSLIQDGTALGSDPGTGVRKSCFHDLRFNPRGTAHGSRRASRGNPLLNRAAKGGFPTCSTCLADASICPRTANSKRAGLFVQARLALGGRLRQVLTDAPTTIIEQKRFLRKKTQSNFPFV